MLRYSNTAHAARRSIARDRGTEAPSPQLRDWQVRAVAAYQQAHGRASAALLVALAASVSQLVGRTIAPEAVFVDHDAGIATVVVDGATFRSHGGAAVLLRTCAECGIGYFESAPLTTPADLGYALSAWQPLCQDCQPEDPANWLES
jgi:hypothetical protein